MSEQDILNSLEKSGVALVSKACVYTFRVEPRGSIITASKRFLIIPEDLRLMYKIGTVIGIIVLN